MDAVEVIDAQADLLFRLTQHDAHGHQGRHGGEPPLMGYLVRLAQRETRDNQLGQALARAYRDTVGRARAYRVQENMTDVIAARADAMPADAAVDDNRRPPRPFGFARLDEPLRFRNVQGEGQAAYWVGWAAFTGPDGIRGWVLTLWNDVFDGPDETTRNLWRDAEAEDPAAYRETSVPDGHREMFGRWAPITIGYVLDGAPLGDVSGGRVPDDDPDVMRTIVALWELLGETAPAPGTLDHVEHADEHLPRTTRRRAQREGIDEPTVTTVVLRRQSRPVQHPGTGVPHDSRVWIEPYEAWRWVGPRHDRRKVRRKIAGHWSANNPELPVRERKIVSELRR